MPRAKRIEYPGAHYHVMCRGNNGQDIYQNDDGRRLFLSSLTESCEQMKWRIHAYCLMSNHYHLLLETPQPNLVAGMKWLQGTYTQRYNAMFKQRGHLFQGRYKALPVETSGGLDYFRMVSTYIHLNPFRAKIAGEGCQHPLQSYKWSSYPTYTSIRQKKPTWLYREKVLGTWGETGEEAQNLRNYKRKLERFMKFELDPDAGRRGDFEKQIKRGWYVGTQDFCSKLLTMLETQNGPLELEGQQRKDQGEMTASSLLEKGLNVLELTEEDLLRMKASAPEKQAVAWLLKMNTPLTLGWIADRLEMGHRVNVSRALSCFRDSKTQKIKTLKKKMLRCTA